MTLKKLHIHKNLNFLAPYKIDGLIRIGSKGDGGYLIPKCLINKTEFLVSLGISDNWSFDAHFKELKPSLKIHAYDHTISNRFFKKNIKNIFLNMLTLRFSWKKLLNSILVWKAYNNFFVGEVKHFQKRIFNKFEKPFDITLDEAIKQTNSHNIFLKIDIEGGEYRIIDCILKNSDKISGIAIEFHETEPLRKVFVDAVKKIQSKFKIVHLHANNFAGFGSDDFPESPEFTFINKKIRAKFNGKRNFLPIKNMDYPNCSGKKDYQINFIS